MREAKSANFTIASLLCFPTAVIAYLPISGAEFGQENNFVLSSSAFADNGTMSQKYMAKNPANPNCIGENISPPLQWHNAPAAARSYAIIMYATDLDLTTLKPGLTMQQMVDAIGSHALVATGLVGRSGR